MGCLKLTYQDKSFYPFGMAMVTYSNSEFAGYRYGFNGQEGDDEVKGDGNSYTAEFWQYDSRLGRRWNTDPVNKIWESDYACFSNNPIFWTDISGADVDPSVINGTPTVNADIQVRFDPLGPNGDGKSKWTEEAKTNYMNDLKANIENTYSSQTYNDVPVVVNITVTEYTGTAAYGSSNDGAVSGADNSVLVDVGSSQPNGNTISNAVKGGGYIYLNNVQDASHEFGHILGLSDRYAETVSPSSNGSNELKEVPTGGRNGTIPIHVKRDEEHSTQNNLMGSSSGGNTLTSLQMKIIFRSGIFKSANERSYFRPIILNAPLGIGNFNTVHCRNLIFFKKVTGYIGDDDITNNEVTFFTRSLIGIKGRGKSNHLITNRVNKGIENRKKYNRTQIKSVP